MNIPLTFFFVKMSYTRNMSVETFVKFDEQVLICFGELNIFLDDEIIKRQCTLTVNTTYVTTRNSVTNRRLKQTSSNIMYFLLCAPAPLIQGVIVGFHV